MGTTEDTEHTERAGRQSCEVRQRQLVHETLTGEIRQVAFEVHRYFGNGFLEKVYENSLAHRLRKLGHEVVAQVPLSVRDEDGTVVGQYVADLLVDDVILIEIKAAHGLTGEHFAQILNYLKATGVRVGMLLNFGQRALQGKRFVQ